MRNEQECIEIYKNRRQTKTETSSKNIRQKYKDFCFPLFNIINKSSSLTRLYVLSYDGNPAAFAFGMVDLRNNSFFTPILSCNTDFSLYSPGHVLICEMVRAFIGEGIEVFDLARGDEPYKYAMGGVNHYNYSFSAMIDDGIIISLQ